MELISGLSINELLEIITREIKRLGYQISVVETMRDYVKLEGVHIDRRNKVEVVLQKQKSRYPGMPIDFPKVKLTINGLSRDEEAILHELFIRARGGG